MLKNWLSKIVGSREDVRELEEVPLEVVVPEVIIEEKPVGEIFDEAVNKAASYKIRGLIEESLKEEVFSKEYMDAYHQAHAYIRENNIDLRISNNRDLIKDKFPQILFDLGFTPSGHPNHIIVGDTIDIHDVLDKLTELYIEGYNENSNKD